MKFLVIRLGKDSVSDIIALDNIKNGLDTPFSFLFKCKQIEEKIITSLTHNESIYCFIYLGSDNNKGIATLWNKGIRAIAQLDTIDGWNDFQSECTLSLRILSVFPESFDKVKFLEDSPELYKNFSNYPIIGLNSSRNNSVQLVHEGRRENTGSLINAILELYPNFRLDVIRNAPELLYLFDQESHDIVEGYDDESQDNSKSIGWGEDYPLNTVLVRNETRTISEVIKRIENNRYKLDPDFQRDFVWSEDKQSKLIESCLMRIPLPVFYVAEDKDGKIIVVDGLQRLTTFKNYLSDKFSLSYSNSNGLNEHATFLGKKFSELPIKLQERIEDTQLIFYILDEKAPERAKLDIFERVNGGEPISRQQMRNCLFSGPGTILLKKIALSEEFLLVTGKGLDSKTMRDREVINRFFAFYLLGYERYNGDMDGFLAQSLLIMNEMESNELDGLKLVFLKSLRNNYKLFQQHSFRKSLANNGILVNRSVINISLFDVFSVIFARLDELYIVKNKKKLIKGFTKLLSTQSFDEAVTIGTNSKNKVNTRFQLAYEMLEEIKNEISKD
ncbi:DUF262 domain-containing protein [Yersinia enterocolitica]